MNIDDYYQEALQLLKQMIEIPSFSKEEDKVASLIFNFLSTKNANIFRKKNNVWAINKRFKPRLPTILLNSHIDTVLPNTGYTNNPFIPIESDGKLYGLGSNDAGGCVVSLIQVFLHFMESDKLKYNIILAITSEEEISGKNGLDCILPEFGNIDFAIVGEPTKMNMAIAEKGLMVIDCVVKGKSGHAARDEGENALYLAMKDIEWLKNLKLPKTSKLLGDVKITTTMIKAGTQHNIVPDKCEYTIDVRSTDKYSNEQLIEIFKENLIAELHPRSIRLNPSAIDETHVLIQAGIKMGRKIFGSPTTSDQALISAPSLKIGLGDSARSHTADEFIYLNEIKEGIGIYIEMLNEIIY